MKNSEFDHNKTGFVTNSQNNDDAPSPQDGACPANGIGPTGTHSCWVFEDNYVHDNNNPNVPGHGTADFGWPGGGLDHRRRPQRHRRQQPLRQQRQLGRARRALPRHRDPACRWRTASAATPTACPPWASRRCSTRHWGNEVAHNTFTGQRLVRQPDQRGPRRHQRQPHARQLLARQHRPGRRHQRAGQPPADQRDLRRRRRGRQRHAAPLTAQAICASELLRPVPAEAGHELPAASPPRAARARAPAHHAQPVRRRPGQPVVHDAGPGQLVDPGSPDSWAS